MDRETFQGFQIDQENFRLLPQLQHSVIYGSYQLLMELAHPAEIEVGKLGLLYFPMGHYLYTGVHRTALIKSKKIHWHVDYLTTDTSLSIRQIFLYPDELGECRINRKFLEISEAKILHPGFGSSDCKNKCAGHLLFLERGEKQLKVWREKYLDVSYRFKNGESIQIISNKS